MKKNIGWIVILIVVIQFFSISFAKNEITVEDLGKEISIKTRLANYVMDKEYGTFKQVYLTFDRGRKNLIYEYAGDGFDILKNGERLKVKRITLMNREDLNGIFTGDVSITFDYGDVKKTIIFEYGPYYSYRIKVRCATEGLKMSLPRVGFSENDRIGGDFFISYYSKTKTIQITIADEPVKISTENELVEIMLKDGLELLNYMGPVKFTLMKELIGEKYQEIKSALDTLPKIKSWYDPIFYGFVEFLSFFYRITGNYGWAIIIFTIIVRLILYPLYHIQTKSMIKMRMIQPKVEEIKKKFKDPQIQQQELMKLYKEEKVNPASGCLPLLIQMPIFILLFAVIRYYKESFAFSPPFLIWPDLSVGGFKENILLVIIDVIISFYNALISSNDKRSARQSVIMGTVFPFLFISFPVALFLYYTVGSVIQFGATYYVHRRYNIKGITVKEFFGLEDKKKKKRKKRKR